LGSPLHHPLHPSRHQLDPRFVAVGELDAGPFENGAIFGQLFRRRGVAGKRSLSLANRVSPVIPRARWAICARASRAAFAPG
jgi:hypothetical protein